MRDVVFMPPMLGIRLKIEAKSRQEPTSFSTRRTGRRS